MRTRFGLGARHLTQCGDLLIDGTSGDERTRLTELPKRRLRDFASGLAMQYLAAGDDSTDGGLVPAELFGKLSHRESSRGIGGEDVC
jgi:hypothetical protein